ncbi:MAG: radical SAM protein [Treponema sp.]|nr:radical SAM protein [Treponema sp.]
MQPFPLITSIDALPPVLAASVSAEERVFIEGLRTRKTGGLPFAITPHIASLAGPDREDPIRRQFFPDPREARLDPFALEDPLGEAHYRVSPRLIHQYRDRVLLLAGGACGGYCRFCFRRVRMSSAPSFISPGELESVLSYLKAHPEIREILISGGDPLTTGNEVLEELFTRLREVRPGLLLRICTRIPITRPERLDQGTVTLFSRWRPLRLVVHINHQRELETGRDGYSAGRILSACVDAGVPVHVQTVLLRGINDSAETLAVLFRECLDQGLTPYYLFQLDLAPGTAHFRVPLKEGLAMYRKLQACISGLGLPAYAVDLPGGGGKIRLYDGAIAGEKAVPGGTVYLLQDSEGKRWSYPAEPV